MNIIILDIHPLEDGRIQRHIKYLLEKKRLPLFIKNESRLNYFF